MLFIYKRALGAKCNFEHLIHAIRLRLIMLRLTIQKSFNADDSGGDDEYEHDGYGGAPGVAYCQQQDYAFPNLGPE